MKPHPDAPMMRARPTMMLTERIGLIAALGRGYGWPTGHRITVSQRGLEGDQLPSRGVVDGRSPGMVAGGTEQQEEQMADDGHPWNIDREAYVHQTWRPDP